MLDLIIADGLVVTGQHERPLHADVGVSEDRIVSLQERLPRGNARRVLNADGMYVCPGFVDIHSHSDLEVLHHPQTDDKIAQGVTTEVVGNCGFSLFPCTEPHRDEALEFLSLLFGDIDGDYLCRDAGEYFRRLPAGSTNIMALVGHNMLRISINGFERSMPPNRLALCLDLLDRQLEAGACGVSTGLLYQPACFSDIEELTAFAHRVRKHRGLFSWHVRDEGDALEQSIDDAISVATRSGAATQISHLKASGRSNWGKMTAVLARIADAVGRGCDLTFDSYPYEFGNSTIMTLLPNEVVHGSVKELRDKLREKGFRQHVTDSMRGPGALLNSVGPENIVIAACSEARNRECEGMSLREAAAYRGRGACDLVCDLIIDEGGRTSIFLHQMSEGDVRLALSHPLGCIGSDGIPAPRGRAHPRLRSAFLCMLRACIGEEPLCSVPEAVRKMSVLPAARLNLTDRGAIEKGRVADLTVFDVDRIKPEPSRRGMDYVVLNGRVVVEDAQFNGTLAGSFLRGCYEHN